MEEQEQIFHDLEERHSLLKRDFAAVSLERDHFKSKCASYSDSVVESNTNKIGLEKQISGKDFELEQRDKVIREFEFSQDDLRERLKRRSEECDRLRDEIKLQGEEIVVVQARLRESQIALNDCQSQLLPVQYDQSRLQRENHLLDERAKSLEYSLLVASNELATERNSASSLKCDLESKISELNAEIESRDKRLKASQDRIAVQNEKIDAYLSKTRDLESTSASQQEVFVRETDNLKRVIDLHKRHFDEAASAVTDLENKLMNAKESSARQLRQQYEEMQSKIEGLQASLAGEREQFSNRISELESQISELQSVGDISRIERDEMNSSSQDLTNASGNMDFIFSGLNVTEVYDRIVNLEKELVHEKAKRKEVDIYLNRILKDIEAKAPLIASQKRDYQRLAESHGQLTKRLDDVIIENSKLRERLHELDHVAQKAVEESQALNQHNKDLSDQLQHLIKRAYDQYQSTTPKKSVALIASDADLSSTSEIISEFLVTYDDINELQVRNAQLLKTIRALEKDLQRSVEAESRAKSGTAEALNTALKELNNMREGRQRTEEMVVGLAQQRDLYKAMVEESDVALTTYRRSSSGGRMSLSPSAVRTPGTPLAITSGESNALLTEAQERLTVLKDENSKLKEKIIRMDETDKFLSASLATAKEDVGRLRTEAAVSSSEARFHKERVERLDETISQLQNESTSNLHRRLDMEKLILEHQRESRNKDDQLRQAADSIRSIQDSLRRAHVEVEVSKAAESRYSSQICELREEIKRQASLSESVHRIEAGLSSRTEEEKLSLISERDFLSKTLEQLRKQVGDKALLDEQHLRSVEDDLKALKTKLDEKNAENILLREDLIREDGTSKSAQERSAILEKQLSIAQERLSAFQGAKTIDSIIEQEVIAKEIAAERAQNEIESLRQQLEIAQGHADQFRKISSATEGMLRELRERSAASKLLLETTIDELKEEIEGLKAELIERRSSSVTSLLEIEEARESLQQLEKQRQGDVDLLNNEISSLKAEAEVAVSQAELYKVDMIKFQQVAKGSFSNYERELQLHAHAQRELREREVELEKTKASLVLAEQMYADLSGEMIRKEKVAIDDRTQYEGVVLEKSEEIVNLKRVNEILHGQIQSLGLQVERLHEARSHVQYAVAGAVGAGEQGVQYAAGTVSSEGESGTSVSSTVSGTVSSSNDGSNEMAELRQANSEMREVVRYMKRERDMLEAKLAVSEGEYSRSASSLAACQRTLDETRIELRRELDKVNSMRSEDEFSRLMAEVHQLNIVRESNAHLRIENENISKKLFQVEDELKKIKNSTMPLEEEIVRLKAEKEAVEASNVQMSKDASYWRERLHQLVARYNEVDPEEHRLLQVKNEELSKQVDALRLELSDKVKSYEAVIASKSTEYSTMQKTYEVAEKNSSNLRNKFREFKTKYDEMSKVLGVKTKAEADLKGQIGSLTSQVAVLTNRLEVSQKELEGLEAAAAAAKAAAASAIVSSGRHLAKSSVDLSSPAVSAPVSMAEPIHVPVHATKAGATTVPVPAVVQVEDKVEMSVEDKSEMLLKERLLRMRDKRYRESSTTTTSTSVSTVTDASKAPAMPTTEDSTVSMGTAPVNVDDANDNDNDEESKGPQFKKNKTSEEDKEDATTIVAVNINVAAVQSDVWAPSSQEEGVGGGVQIEEAEGVQAMDDNEEEGEVSESDEEDDEGEEGDEGEEEGEEEGEAVDMMQEQEQEQEDSNIGQEENTGGMDVSHEAYATSVIDAVVESQSTASNASAAAVVVQNEQAVVISGPFSSTGPRPNSFGIHMSNFVARSLAQGSIAAAGTGTALKPGGIISNGFQLTKSTVPAAAAAPLGFGFGSGSRLFGSAASASAGKTSPIARNIVIPAVAVEEEGVDDQGQRQGDASSYNDMTYDEDRDEYTNEDGGDDNDIESEVVNADMTQQLQQEQQQALPAAFVALRPPSPQGTSAAIPVFGTGTKSLPIPSLSTTPTSASSSSSAAAAATNLLFLKPPSNAPSLFLNKQNPSQQIFQQVNLLPSTTTTKAVAVDNRLPEKEAVPEATAQDKIHIPPRRISLTAKPADAKSSEDLLKQRLQRFSNEPSPLGGGGGGGAGAEEESAVVPATAEAVVTAPVTVADASVAVAVTTATAGVGGGGGARAPTTGGGGRTGAGRAGRGVGKQVAKIMNKAKGAKGIGSGGKGGGGDA